MDRRDLVERPRNRACGAVSGQPLRCRVGRAARTQPRVPTCGPSIRISCRRIGLLVGKGWAGKTSCRLDSPGRPLSLVGREAVAPEGRQRSTEAPARRRRRARRGAGAPTQRRGRESGGRRPAFRGPPPFSYCLRLLVAVARCEEVSQPPRPGLDPFQSREHPGVEWLHHFQALVLDPFCFEVYRWSIRFHDDLLYRLGVWVSFAKPASRLGAC